jgi:type II secretory pathway component PulF
LQRTQQALQGGVSLTDALQLGELLADQATEQLIASGEVSGRLDEMLQHVIEGLDRQLHEQLDSLAEWLPRLVYALIVGFVVSRLL